MAGKFYVGPEEILCGASKISYHLNTDYVILELLGYRLCDMRVIRKQIV